MPLNPRRNKIPLRGGSTPPILFILGGWRTLALVFPAKQQIWVPYPCRWVCGKGGNHKCKTIRAQREPRKE